MKNIDIAFVVLHYMNSDTTEKAVEHILSNCDTSNMAIIVVDNASTNNSFDILTEKYSSNSSVILLRNQTNLGFACGNNVGFRYAKENYHPRYIILLNSDAYLTEKNLLQKLDEEYNSSHFYVAGPMIYGNDGNNTTNPWGKEVINTKICKYTLKKANTDLFFSRLHLYKLLCIYRRHTPFPRKKAPKGYSLPINPADGQNLHLYKNYNLSLHGSCFIFSEAFIKDYDGLDSRTFLYDEESLLHLQMLMDGRTMVYMPEISILHVGSASSSYECDENSKRIKCCKYSIHSTKIILSEINKFKKAHGGKEPGEVVVERMKEIKK